MREITPNRIHSVDILRGLAIFFMIFVHYGQSWLNINSLILFTPYFFIPAFFGAPIFLVLVGISFSISAERRKLQKNFKKHVFKRACLLIILQFLLNIVIFDIKQVWAYEVLTLIGISTIVCYYLMKRTDLEKIVFVIISFLLVPILKDTFNDQIEIFTLFEPIWDLGKFFRASLFAYPFSFLPYISYMIFGTMVGDRLVRIRGSIKNELIFCKNLILFGFLMILIGLGPRIFNSPLIDAYESGLHICLTTGVVMILLSGLYWLEDVKKISLFRPFALYGQISLTFLIGHHFINKYFFYYSFKVFKNLEIYPYLFLVSFLCISFWIIVYFWSIVKYKFSLDWIVRKLG
ncbi:MAG: heparan-alpha-glucosaminide N-acetyltransferase domain-containing protein [Candidatus Helarchaeota archaeon]